MSYNLFFEPRHGVFDPALFAEYFRSRTHYELRENQAMYGNPDSGVYFGFELEPPSEDPDERHFPVTFNINFYRPSYFIHEAEPEVTAFVRHFDMLVLDPQINGMGEGEYQSQLLIAGWNCGSELAFSAFLRKRKAARKIATLPTATLMEIWRWNLGRAARQARFGEAKFVPRILFLRINGWTRSAVVWTNGIPSVIPEVAYLIVLRQKPVPVRPGITGDCALLAWEVARPLLERHGSMEADRSFILDYELEPPEDLARFLQSLPRHTRIISSLRADEVLDRELVEKHTPESMIRRVVSWIGRQCRRIRHR